MKDPRQIIDEIAVLLYGILFLFFFQLLTDFVAAIYAFGLMGTGIPIEIVFVLLLFTPLFLLIPRRGLSPRWLLLLALVFILARCFEVSLDTRNRMLISGLGVGFFLLYFPPLLWQLGKERHQERTQDISAGLLLAVLFSILLRALNSGVDLSTNPGAPWVTWVLAILAVFLLTRSFRQSSKEPYLNEFEETQQLLPSFGRILGLCVGISAIFILIFFTFIAPNVLARWTGAPYLPLLLAVLLTIVVFAVLNLVAGGVIQILPARMLYFWGLLFALALTISIFLNQLHFPADPQAYPFYEVPLGFMGYLPLFITIILFPVLFLAFTVMIRELIRLHPPSRYLAVGFSLGSLYILIMILAHIFTTTYDYIPVVGGFFRNRFWFVYFIASIAAFLPLLLIQDRGIQPRRRYTTSFIALLLIIGGAAWMGAYLVSASPNEYISSSVGLRVMTYNVQQGYSKDGLKNYDGQLDLIRTVNPDVLGLQETDTNRIANSNDDLVRYFADGLDMYSYYGPQVVQGTFGIALLSKYPLLNPQTFYMFSEGEQTATIYAQIEVGGLVYNLFITHLGNGGPLVQQEAILAESADLENVILMGDFNFRPDTEQYQYTVEILDDAWHSLWQDGDDGSGMDPEKRIDHIFTSPYIEVLESRFFTQPEADHPALFALIH